MPSRFSEPGDVTAVTIRQTTQATAFRDIIVVGASRGGLKALCALTQGLPAGLPAAVLIVLHTGADSPRLLADILGRCTPLPVAYAIAGKDIRPGHIYVAPPGAHLIVVPPGHIGLDSGPKVHHSRPAADRLFQTAAAVYAQRVIGVVLTGGDGDGTDGLRAIKTAGGVSIVQQPAEAVDPSMPISAIRDDVPDHCLAVADMGSLLAALVDPSMGGEKIPGAAMAGQREAAAEGALPVT